MNGLICPDSMILYEPYGIAYSTFLVAAWLVYSKLKR